MELFNERFDVYCNEINEKDEGFIKNIKVNIDHILAFNECNCCHKTPNRIRVVFYEDVCINKNESEICVVLYAENCRSDVPYIHVDLILSGRSEEAIYDFVIKAIINGKKFSLLR